MKNKLITLFILSLIVALPCQSQVKITISGKSKDATAEVRQALEKCTDPDESYLLSFPEGTYHFWPDEAVARYKEVVHHDAGYRYIAFPVQDIANLTIEGNGSEFIFHGRIIPMEIWKSRNISLKNFSIDWEIPFTMECRILVSNEDEKWIEFVTDHPYRISDGTLYMQGEDWEVPVGGNTLWDPETMTVYYNSKQYSLRKGSLKAKQLDNGVVRLYADAQLMPPVGSVLVLKGFAPLFKNRHSPGIHILESENVKLENVVLHHTGGMGIIAERSTDIALDDCAAKLKEGSGRIVTTAADATHFSGCKGTVLMENCLFENTLDDATNIHGNYSRVKKVFDDRTLGVELVHHQQHGFIFAGLGDTIRFIQGVNLMPYSGGPYLVESWEPVNDHYAILRVDRKLENDVLSGDGVENLTWNPVIILRNNIIQNKLARGFLVNSTRSILVENNVFRNLLGSCLVFEGDLNYWHDSGPVYDVVFRNNVFEDWGIGGLFPRPCIFIWPEFREDQDILAGPYYYNIRIKNNEFRNFDASMIQARSVEGLEIIGNTFSRTGTYPPLFGEEPAIDITGFAKGVIISGNEWDATAHIRIAESVKDITMKRNRNLKKYK